MDNIISQITIPFIPQQHGPPTSYRGIGITNIEKQYLLQKFRGKIKRPIRNGKRNLGSLGTAIRIPESPTATSNAAGVNCSLTTNCNNQHYFRILFSTCSIIMFIDFLLLEIIRYEKGTKGSDKIFEMASKT